METETIETFSEERTIAVQKQEIELHDSASILVKLSLRTMKGMVEIDPVKFTLDHPDDGSRPHYGVDKGDIAEDEQALCISMAIDLRDGYSQDMSMHDYNVQTLDSNQTISMVTAQRKALEGVVQNSLDRLDEESCKRLGIAKLGSSVDVEDASQRKSDDETLHLESVVKYSLDQLGEESFKRLGIKRLGTDEDLLTAQLDNDFESEAQIRADKEQRQKAEAEARKKEEEERTKLEEEFKRKEEEKAQRKLEGKLRKKYEKERKN